MNETAAALLDDGWAQALMLAAAVSGIFMLHYYLSRRPAAASVPAPAAGAAPARAGRWLVDARRGAGADFATLAEAVAAAADGDEIALAPGVYRESITTSKSLSFLGRGAAPDDVRWIGGLDASSAHMRLENLSFEPPEDFASWAVSVRDGSLAMKEVRLRSSGRGVRAEDADVTAQDCALDALVALQAEGSSRVSVTGGTLSGDAAAVRAEGRDVDVELDGATSRDSRGSLLDASEGARARLESVRVSGSGQPSIVASGKADVTVESSWLTDSRECAVRVNDAAVSLQSSHLLRDRCGVGFVGAGSLETDSSEFSALTVGPVAVQPGLDGAVSVTGSGNSGFTVPKTRP